MLIGVVMFDCIIAGSLCLIVGLSVLSCVAACCISCGLSAVEINEELLLLLLLSLMLRYVMGFKIKTSTSYIFYGLLNWTFDL